MTASARESLTVAPSSPPKVPPEALQQAVHQQIRRSICDTQFLKDYVANGLHQSETSNIELVTGNQATEMYKDYLERADAAEQHTQPGADTKRSNSQSSTTPNVVFALPAHAAGRKLVDFYMTWRGRIPSAKQLKGSRRRSNFLDAEFKKLRRGLQTEYKRISQYSNPDDIAAVPRTPAANTPLALPSTPYSTPALDLADDNDQLRPPPPIQTDGIGRTSGSIVSGSVQSLPYLDIRHGAKHVPLAVVNPDRPRSPTDSLLPRLHLSSKPTPETPTAPNPLHLAPDTPSLRSPPKPNSTHQKKKARPSAENSDSSNPNKRDSKIILVVLDDHEKTGGTVEESKGEPHKAVNNGRESKGVDSTAAKLVRKESTVRRSRWNGEPAFTKGAIATDTTAHRTPPRSRRTSFRDPSPPHAPTPPLDDDDETSSSEESLSDRSTPPVPLRTLLASLGHAPPTPDSMSTPLFTSSSTIPPAPAYSPYFSPGHHSVASGFASLPSLSSAAAYSPYQQTPTYPPSFTPASVYGTPLGFVPQSIQATPMHHPVTIPVVHGSTPQQWQPIVPMTTYY